MALAIGLGMDVPFFLGPGRAVGTGRGEVLKPVPTVGGYAMVLVNPGVPLSTQEVYGRVPAGWQAKPEGTKRMLEALRTRNAAKVAAALTNHLERWVEPAMPVIGRMKAAVGRGRGSAGSMSEAGRRYSAWRGR